MRSSWDKVLRQRGPAECADGDSSDGRRRRDAMQFAFVAGRQQLSLSSWIALALVVGTYRSGRSSTGMRSQAGPTAAGSGVCPNSTFARTCGGGERGRVVLRLDASGPFTAAGARATFGLPHVHARMRGAVRGGRVKYSSERSERRAPVPAATAPSSPASRARSSAPTGTSASTASWWRAARLSAVRLQQPRAVAGRAGAGLHAVHRLPADRAAAAAPVDPDLHDRDPERAVVPGPADPRPGWRVHAVGGVLVRIEGSGPRVPAAGERARAPALRWAVRCGGGSWRLRSGH